jgi:hypothetical protein
MCSPYNAIDTIIIIAITIYTKVLLFTTHTKVSIFKFGSKNFEAFVHPKHHLLLILLLLSFQQ